MNHHILGAQTTRDGTERYHWLELLPDPVTLIAPCTFVRALGFFRYCRMMWYLALWSQGLNREYFPNLTLELGTIGLSR